MNTSRKRAYERQSDIIAQKLSFSEMVPLGLRSAGMVLWPKQIPQTTPLEPGNIASPSSAPWLPIPPQPLLHLPSAAATCSSAPASPSLQRALLPSTLLRTFLQLVAMEVEVVQGIRRRRRRRRRRKWRVRVEEGVSVLLGKSQEW